MDKKSTFIGILLLLAGFLMMTYNASKEADYRREAAKEKANQPSEQTPSPAIGTPSPSELIADNLEAPVSPPESGALESGAGDTAPQKSLAEIEERTLILENEHIAARLTNLGGAIESITLKKFPAQNPHTHESPRPIRINDVANVPALSLSQTVGTQFTPMIGRYRVIEETPDRVVFEGRSGALLVRRVYELVPTNDEEDSPLPYTVRHSTEFRNIGSGNALIGPVFFNLGTAAPTDADVMGYNLSASYLRDGDYKSISSGKFRGGGFLGIGGEPKERVERIGLIEWGAVKNQFFTTIMTPDRPAEAMVATRVLFPPDPRTGDNPVGVSGSLRFSLPPLNPDGFEKVTVDFYAGPKDFDRLTKIGNQQEDVLQLSWFMGLFIGLVGFVGKTLLTLMGAVHGAVGNWGVAIIITTLIIRLVLFPLTAKAARASKRMQKLSEPLKQIREKYADNQQKLNEEMMKLWKKHKINPLSGCWPVLLQFPIFIAFFNLLRNSADLRYAEFLWISDLSMPDRTISLGEASLPFVGSHINVLPFVWLASMYWQMKMMPQPSIDSGQAKIIKFMPFIFFPFTYIFSSGLVLYWTTTNGFSILQQWLTNRIKDDEDEAIEHEIEEKETKNKANAPLITKKKKNKKKK